MISPFPAAHTWRLFLDFLQSSFLIQPGAQRRLALSSLGPFFTFVQKGISCGTAYCLAGSSAVFPDTPPWEPSLQRASQGRFFQLSLGQPPSHYHLGRKQIMAVGIEREAGDDRVKLFLCSVEEREDQRKVMSPVLVTELLVPSLVTLLSFFFTHPALEMISWGEMIVLTLASCEELADTPGLSLDAQ